MKGYRKLVMAAIFAAGIMAFDMSPTQAEVMQVLIMSVFAGNSLEHISQGVSSAIRSRSGAGAARASRPVTDPKQSLDKGAH